MFAAVICDDGDTGLAVRTIRCSERTMLYGLLLKDFA